jgi:hypothetical protein
MTKRRLRIALACASLAVVFTAAAVSRNDRWNFNFAQYKGPDRPEPKDEFRFVMVGDRNGGRVPGLMPQAFREINHLYPDFVICVGDLIDGPTTASEKIGQFWKEFDDEVALLKSPFVYLPGNHDIWNPTSKGIYEERYGATYRSFNYRGLHFITLDTEEMDANGRKIDRIAGKQLEWLKEDLEQNKNARRILVFMHKPIWLSGGLAAAEKLWQGMPVHVFAGHDHRYSFQEIDGIPHVILGAVAGGFRDEGEALGRFRHYVMATVRDDDLKLALIRLGGVLPPDTVLEQELPGIRLLADACGLYRDGADDSGGVHMCFRNPLGCDVKLQIQRTSYGAAKPVAQPLFRSDVPTLKQDELCERSLDATVMGGAGVSTEFKATYEFINAQGLAQKIDFPVDVRRRRIVTATRLASAPTIDGNIDDWSDAAWQSIEEPAQVIAAANAWKGPEDLSAKFAVALDEQNVYIAVRVTDDTVAFNTQVADEDGIELYLASPPRGEICFARDPEWHRLIVTPFAAGGTTQGDATGAAHSIAYGSGRVKPTQAAYVREANGYTIELALPRQEIGWSGGREVDRQFDIMINDRDRGTRRESQLVWSGTAGNTSSSRYYGRVSVANP